MEKYTFHVLGCRGSRPVSGQRFQEFGGATSCYIIKSEDHAIVLDCGTGLYDARTYLKDCTRIDVLLTHLHYDHILGFLDCSVFPSGARVRIYAGVQEYSSDYNPTDFLKVPFWPVSTEIGETICVGCNSTLHLAEGVSASFYPANHPDNATIIRVDTPDGTVCLACDWEHGDKFPEKMTEGCDFMLYDGMFTELEYPSRKGWGHSIWQAGVALAKKRNIPKLMITHHLPERTDKELAEMERNAAKSFSRLRFCRAGDVYTMTGEIIR